MLQSALVADEIASRHVPVFFLQLYLVVVTLWVGGDACEDTDMDAFWGFWPVLAAGAWLGGFYTSWYTRSPDAGFSRRFAFSLLESLQSPLYFVAFTFVRAKPIKCLGDGLGPRLAYTIGPVMLIFVYLGSLAYYFVVVRRIENADAIGRFARMDPSADSIVPPSTSGSGADVPEAFAYAALMGRSVLALVRRKLPLTTIILHYLVVSLAVGNDGCDDGHTGWFIGYLTTLLVLSFAYRFGATRRIRTGLGPAEHLAFAVNEAVQSSLYLLVFALIRAKPVKCLASGLSLAYATSVPLLLLVNLYAVCSSYLWLRTYTPRQLVDMQVFPNDKQS
jgi:hypothetical protein